jgi:hypothetical protein
MHILSRRLELIVLTRVASIFMRFPQVSRCHVNPGFLVRLAIPTTLVLGAGPFNIVAARTTVV